MSKVVILIFATLVASTVDASDSTDRLRSVQEEFESYLTNVIDELDEKYNTSILSIMDNVTEFVDRLSSKDGTFNDLRSIWKKAKEDTLELRKTLSIIEGSQKCVKILDKISMGNKAILAIQHTQGKSILHAFYTTAEVMMAYENFIDDLRDYRIMMGACARVFNTNTEVESVISCIKKVRNKAEVHISRNIPFVTSAINMVKNLLNSSLKEARMDGFDEYKVTAANLTKQAIECYQRLMPITLEPTEAAPTTLEAANEVGAN